MAKNSSEVLGGRKPSRPDAGKSPYPPSQQGRDGAKENRESERNARNHQKSIDKVGYGYDSDK